MSNNECCFKNILCIIENLQNNVEKLENINCSCDRPFLGNCCGNSPCFYNTRPVTFYTCNNELITIPYTLTYNGTTITGTSSVFRVEKVNECCCTCMVLAPNPNAEEAVDAPYVATNSYTNINLNCVCAIRCLPDTFINCI